jgi:hypothetical protein
MIKTKNDENGVVTKGWFREAMRESMDEFAMMVNKGFVGVESRIGGLEGRMGALESRMGKLEEHMEARFKTIESTMATKEDLLIIYLATFNYFWRFFISSTSFSNGTASCNPFTRSRTMMLFS